METEKTDKLVNDVLDLLKKSPLYSPVFGVPSAEFFSYPELWERLRYKVIPDYISNQPERAVLKSWVACCQTGQEAYSLAIVFKEVIEEIRSKSGITLKILASDVNMNRIEFAKKGIYSFANTGPYCAEKIISQKRIDRFFNKLNRSRTYQWYQVKSEIKNMVEFQTHDVFNDSPFTENNFISCLFLMDWLDAEARGKLVKIFFDSLVPDGVFWDYKKVYYRKELQTLIK